MTVWKYKEPQIHAEIQAAYPRSSAFIDTYGKAIREYALQRRDSGRLHPRLKNSKILCNQKIIKNLQ
ncbi:MAG: hypothetical protein CVV36_04700 [Candidatus Methanoperedenaceae archaeon HGW-Methanoperedenaceae-1]|nr:MAG: hypothetical protein CVV36_04700 [Candidatus Methanoperedenaceae archaeon HGW-Methanoperedenaceae-1]